MTDAQVVAQTNELARLFYAAHGYRVEEGYRFDEARHPQERGMWNLAVIAQEFLTSTDAEAALESEEFDRR